MNAQNSARHVDFVTNIVKMKIIQILLLTAFIYSNSAIADQSHEHQSYIEVPVIRIDEQTFEEAGNADFEKQESELCADSRVEEQAFVKADIAWCVNPDCFVDGLWSRRRSPECIYERRYSLFSAVCDIDSDKDWRTADDWTIVVNGPRPGYEDSDSDQYHFFYLHKMTFDGKPPIYSISWNANMEGEPVYSHAQWNMGEDYTYSKHPEKDIHTIEGFGSKIVLNFEISLTKYPEPENNTWHEHYEDALCTASLNQAVSELMSLQRARIKQLMELKIESIRSNKFDSEKDAESLVNSAIEVQEAWDTYATARGREVAASYRGGTGRGYGFGRTYFDLQVERIKDLLAVYK